MAKTKSYSDPPDPEYQGLGDLQTAMKPWFNWWMARHLAAPLVGGAIGGVEGYIDPESHKNPWLQAGTRALEAATLYGGLHAMAAPSFGSQLANARYAIGTGQLAGPRNRMAAPVGEALRNLIFGQGASGAY